MAFPSDQARACAQIPSPRQAAPEYVALTQEVAQRHETACLRKDALLLRSGKRLQWALTPRPHAPRRRRLRASAGARFLGSHPCQCGKLGTRRAARNTTHTSGVHKGSSSTGSTVHLRRLGFENRRSTLLLRLCLASPCAFGMTTRILVLRLSTSASLTFVFCCGAPLSVL
jgi:hypothetical protein